MSVVDGPGRARHPRGWGFRLALGSLAGLAVGVLVGMLADASPGVVAGSATGVAVATFLVQVFTWLDTSRRGDGGPPPSAMA